MDAAHVAHMIDHTLLKPEATVDQVRALFAEGGDMGVFSCCVSPSMLPLPVGTVPNGVKVCIVVGFPSGAVRPEIKAAEAAYAVASGADEVDMVINFGWAKEGRFSEIQADVQGVRDAIPGTLLKVILETSTLTDDEIVRCCEASVSAGADYVKTSTGMHPSGGASVHAISLMRKTVGPDIGVKASGGIRSGSFALALIDAGASRLGVSGTRQVLDDIAAGAVADETQPEPAGY